MLLSYSTFCRQSDKNGRQVKKKLSRFAGLAVFVLAPCTPIKSICSLRFVLPKGLCSIAEGCACRAYPIHLRRRPLSTGQDSGPFGEIAMSFQLKVIPRDWRNVAGVPIERCLPRYCAGKLRL